MKAVRAELKKCWCGCSTKPLAIVTDEAEKYCIGSTVCHYCEGRIISICELNAEPTTTAFHPDGLMEMRNGRLLEHA